MTHITKTRRKRRGLRLDHTLFVVVALVGLLLVGISSSFYYNRELIKSSQDMQRVQTDNMTWTISQLEVEFRRMELALERAWGNKRVDQKEFIKTFDIFYSRVSSFEAILARAELGLGADDIATIITITDLRNEMARLIDETPAGQPLPYATLFFQVEKVSPKIREALVSIFALLTKRTNEFSTRHQDLLNDYGSFSIYYEIALVVVLLLGLRLNYVAQARAKKMRDLSDVFEKTIECSADAVIVCDENIRVTQFNPAAERILGYSQDEAIGTHVKDLIVPDHLMPLFHNELKMLLQTGTNNILAQGRSVRRARDKSGREFPAEVTAVSTKTSHGVPIYLLFLRDISSRHETQRKLEKALATAEESVRARERFLAVMSHEMRTPLQGVIASLDLIKESDSDLDHDQLVETALKSSEQALAQVNNILEFTRMSEKGSDDHKVNFKLIDVAHDLAHVNQSLLLTKGNRVNLILDPECERTVWGSKRDLDTLMQNLFSNANKFTADGALTIRMKSQGIQDGKLSMRIQVEDTGIGIPDHMKARVFDDFETANKDVPSKQMGTGLGLGIAKRAADRLGGKLDLTSEIGIGTIFTLRVDFDLVEDPQEALPEPAPVDHQPQDFSGFSVLIAEDHSTNRKLIEMMLGRFGFDVTSAEDGREAVECAKHGRFDLVVTDINMPNMGGLEAAAIISQQEQHLRTPIIAMTAFTVEDLAEFDQAGIAFIVPKPVTLSSISRMLKRLCEEGHLTRSHTNDDTYPPPQTQEAPMDHPNSLDTSIFDELVMIAGPDAARSFVDKFVQEQRDFIDNANRLLLADDTQAASKIAHKAIGSAALMGASELAKTMRIVQNNAKSDQRDQSLQELGKASKMLEMAQSDMENHLKTAC